MILGRQLYISISTGEAYMNKPRAYICRRQRHCVKSQIVCLIFQFTKHCEIHTIAAEFKNSPKIRRLTVCSYRFEGLVAPLLHQHVELYAMLVDRQPLQIRFTSHLDEHLVKVRDAARHAPYGFHTVSKVLTEFVATASDRFIAHNYSTLEEQFLDVAQTQLEAKIPTHGATDDLGRKTVTVIKRFRFFHRAILRDRSHNLTMPLGGMNVGA